MELEREVRSRPWGGACYNSGDANTGEESSAAAEPEAAGGDGDDEWKHWVNLEKIKKHTYLNPKSVNKKNIKNLLFLFI